MRIVVRPQRVIVVSQLEDDTTRKRLREVNDLMKGAPPGATLADVIAARCMREREAEGRRRFENLWKYGQHSPEQGELFEKPKVDTEAIREKLMEIIPETGSVVRWDLWQVMLETYPEMPNFQRQELLEQAVEELLAVGLITESPHMEYTRTPPRIKQSEMDRFFS